MPNFTLTRYESPDLVAQFQAHLKDCPRCRLATSQRTACHAGTALHEAMVLDAARSARRGASWLEKLDLAELPTERSFTDRLRELRADTGPIEGVDTSVWQGSFPWGAAVSAGIGWGLAKASEGDGFTDPQWGANLAALLAPGPIVAGSYHFARPDLGNPASAEAGWYLSRHPAACFSPILPWIFCLDAESAGGGAAWCYGFLDAASSRIGYSCWFYSFANWISSRAVKAFNRPLFIAWPNPGAPPSEGWPAISAVQYGTRTIGGVSVDADRFFGGRTALLTLAGVSSVPSPPAPPSPIPSGGSRMHAYHPTIEGRVDLVWLDPTVTAAGPAGTAHQAMHSWSNDGSQTWESEIWGTSPGCLMPGTESIAWDAWGHLCISGAGPDGAIWAATSDITADHGVWTRWVAGPVAVPAPQGPAGPAGPPGPAYDDSGVKAELARHEAGLQAFKSAAGSIE